MTPDEINLLLKLSPLPGRGFHFTGVYSAFKPMGPSVIEFLEPRQLLSISPLPSTSGTPEVYSAQQTIVARPVVVIATVVTDKLDYSPGETASITGKNFKAGEQVRLQVLHIDGTPNTAPRHRPWIVRADASGGFRTGYVVGLDDLRTTLQLTAVGLSSGRRAQEIFKDAKSPTTTKLTSSVNPAVYGQSVTFTSTVTSGATGVVTFQDGTTTLGTGTLNGSGQVVFVTSSLTVASHSIVASYAGDGTHNASSSTALSQTIRKASTRVALGVVGTPPTTPILRPSHIVVVVEEDRFANALGDSANLPYFNQLASSGLAFTRTHGLNNTNQEGQMTYLGLYSGSTQGVTDNSNHGVFTGANLAQSLANNGLSFGGYSESLPYDGDTRDNYAADPTNPEYDDLYVRAYNPMAQFSSVGTGLTNANVNRTFASFPTTAAGYASLPTVSFVIPNTAHNTHGSNSTDPYATDPNNYNYFRQNADLWLQQKMDGYIQWARQNNSLIIVTGDEGDRAHTFANGFTTLIAGAANLFVPGTDATSVNSYNLLRTIEDMYGLPQLGNTVAASELPTNSQGQLSPAQAGGISAVGQSVTFSASVTPISPGGGIPAGTIQFVLDGSNVGSAVALSGGSAISPGITFLTQGAHTLSAVYGATNNYETSTAPNLTQTVIPASTTTVLTTNVSSAVWGQGVSFTATISTPATGVGAPSGTVTFMDGATRLGIATLNSAGQTTFTASSLSVGSHAITAVYAGNATFTGSASSALNEGIARDMSTVSLTSSANPIVVGQSVTLAATAIAAFPGSGTPTGTVTFMDGIMVLGSVTLNSIGQALYTTSALSVALHSIAAAYGGDTYFVGGTSATLAESVTAGATGPANNNFASATAIVGTSATLSGTNSGATKEAGEPAHAGNVGGKSVWWSWTAPSSGLVNLDTKTSTFDTLLAVYTGTSVSALSAVPAGSNDDDPAGGGLITSSVAFVAQTGTTYRIAVDGYGGVSGAITLHLSLASLAAPAAPTGVKATQGVYSNKVQVSWSLVSGATAYEVWRSTTNNSATAAKISASDVMTNAYDDTTAAAGTVYFYWVAAKNSAGTSALSASAAGSLALSNDDFSNATIINGTNASLTGTNTAATKQTGEPSHAGNVGGKSVWWSWTAQSSGIVTIDTLGSTFDTLLGVYTGASVNTLSAVPGGSNDDDFAGGTITSKVSFAVTAGTVYKIAVDGYGGVSGSILLHLNFA